MKFVLTLLLLTAAIPAAGGEQLLAPLTLERALREFRARAFDLILADATIASARADLAVASAIPNPSVSLSRGSTSGYDPSACAGCSNTSLSGGLTDQAAISDFLTGKRRLRTDVARATLDATKHSRADVERTLEFTLKQQLLQAELAKQSLRYADEARHLASEMLDLVNARYKAGAVSEADVARVEVQKLEVEQTVDVAQQTLESAKAQLAYLLAYDGSPHALDVGDDLIRPSAPRLSTASREKLIEEALTNRPDLAAVRSQLDRARASVDLARRLRVPDVLPSLQYSQEGRGQNAIQPPTVTVGFSATVPAFYRYGGEVARARADLRTQETAQAKIAAQVRSDVSSGFASFESAKKRAGRMEGRLLARAARARDLVRLQYEKGAASLFEFLDAQRTYLATQTEYLQTLNDYWTAIFQLEEATGEELSQ
ncbi:MAG: TolC family protein [Thermoanaerobaculia bacterium]